MQQIKRLNYLTQWGRTEEEYGEREHLEDKLGKITEGEMEAIQENIKLANQELRKLRSQQWSQWIKEHTAKPINVFDWVKRTNALQVPEGLHWGGQRKPKGLTNEKKLRNNGTPCGRQGKNTPASKLEKSYRTSRSHNWNESFASCHQTKRWDQTTGIQKNSWHCQTNQSRDSSTLFIERNQKDNCHKE